MPAPTSTPRAAAPPAALAQAAGAFLRGDATAALAALDAFRPANPLERAHACLLRAATLHQQAVAAATSTDPDLAATRAALAACAWREQRLVLSPLVFSPRFVLLAQSVR